MTTHGIRSLPPAQGLYDPAFEHDACGIGFIAHLRGERSHAIIDSALELLRNLAHRSAVGGDGETSDGAGMLLHIPHVLLRDRCRGIDIALPDAGEYGVGMLFLPTHPDARREAERIVEHCVAERGCRVLGWRDVPMADEYLGADARDSRPAIRQVFIAPAALHRAADDAPEFERTLYVIRRAIERAARVASAATTNGDPLLYVASFSSRTVVYKGLVRAEDLASFYPDLADSSSASGLALVHSRFATNTFPSWARAHPYRVLCHNGEINTLHGNLTWTRVREEQMASSRFGDAFTELVPVIEPDQSDSASLDNLVELLLHAGRPVSHAMAMLIPKAWEHDTGLSADRRAFYEYHASLSEAWDGPAAVAFTDGRQIGALLDRNGLRPARWMLTEDDLVVLASEAGALSVPDDRIRAKGRLRPGTMLAVNTTQGRLLLDDEIQAELASRHPYARWIVEQRRALRVASDVAGESTATLDRLRRFGYTREEMNLILGPMAATGEEPIGSMGNDAPIALLSERPQLLYSYFRQRFAQVTNPAIDPIRERVVMSLAIPLGPLGNVLDEAPAHARYVRLDSPVLDHAMMAAIRTLDATPLRTLTLPAVFRAGDGPDGLEPALAALCLAAERAIDDGYSIIVVSDRESCRELAPIPSALALSAVHHHLIRRRLRSRVNLVVESGDAREVSHIALLFSYGASAVHPYLALDACAGLARDGIVDATEHEAKAHYIKAVEKGLLKVLSKMGISTLQGYCGAQVWEAVGLGPEVVRRHFTGTPSRIGGIELRDVAEDVLRRHDASDATELLDDGGEYHVRARGEQHAWNPTTLVTLQRAAREADLPSYRAFSRAANDGELRQSTLRGLLDFVDCVPVRLEDVEPASAIVRRFATGAMSFGSISAEAHETLALAMNQLGGRSNTGEGGEDPARFGTTRNSAIKQVASARFGVTTEYLANARELQIKIAQGAKPGEGGQLPGHKVDRTIARIRHSTPGVALISPPPHHDIYSIEDLKQLIYDLRCVNPSATISVKLVAEAGVGTVAAGVAKAGADLIVISGDSGGTGASPLSSIKRAGVPWEIGLAEAHQTLVLNGLRNRVRLQTDGQLKTGRDVVVAALLGADEFGFATAPLVVQGCVMMRKCHLNTCPVGIATQDPILREKFTGRPEHLINYFFFVAEEARELMARLGVRSLDEIVGHVELLQRRPSPVASRASTIDLSALLHPVKAPRATSGNESSLAAPKKERVGSLLSIASPAIERGEAVRALVPVRTADRAIGAEIAGEIARRHGHAGLPPDSICLRLRGSAGQSFGAFATRGMSLELEGEANDYVAKGLSGGRVVVRPPRGSSFATGQTPLIGNTALYGATGGELFVAGGVGERFAVRNSGATAVVESVGDHGCEYMTGGRVIVLGAIGRNFAAGMSGGIVYVLDERADHRARWMVPDGMEVEPIVGTEDERIVRRLLDRHARYTGSRNAKRLLGRWENAAKAFVRVIPVDYKRALAAQREELDAAEAEAPRYG